jgi:hypothetical protein
VPARSSNKLWAFESIASVVQEGRVITTDVQASMNTVQIGLHQSLQTKRERAGKRPIVK